MHSGVVDMMKCERCGNSYDNSIDGVVSIHPLDRVCMECYELLNNQAALKEPTPRNKALLIIGLYFITLKWKIKAWIRNKLKKNR